MKKRGFTLIELLVVVSIISLLSSVVLASLNTARIKARDARRQTDMHSIYTALNLFYDQYGCLPRNNGSTCIAYTNGADAGNWDYSSQGTGFLSFLQTAGYMSSVPVDPINNMTGDATAGQYAYRYHCYIAGDPNQGLNLAYWKESPSRTLVQKNVSAPFSDPTFVCR